MVEMIIAIITVIIEASKPNAPPVNVLGADIDAVTMRQVQLAFPKQNSHLCSLEDCSMANEHLSGLIACF